jgi:hypothetical protein
MGKTVLCFSLILFLLTAGCEDTDIGLATQAGMDAVRAVSLDDAEVRRTAVALAQQFDLKHTVAPSANPYAKRLGGGAGDFRLDETGRHWQRSLPLVEPPGARSARDQTAGKRLGVPTGRKTFPAEAGGRLVAGPLAV